MTEVGVHLDDVIGPVLQGAGHALDVGPPQPVLLGTVQDTDTSAVFDRELVGDLAGAVGRVVVDHHDPQFGEVQGHEAGDEDGEVAGLVVGGDDHGQAGAPPGLGKRHRFGGHPYGLGRAVLRMR